MRPEPDRIELLLAFVTDPRLDQVGREDVPLQQERVVALERVDRLLERAGGRADAGLRHLLPCHLVDVAVKRRAGFEPVLNAIELRYQHPRPSEIPVAARVGAAELEPLRLRA